MVSAVTWMAVTPVIFAAWVDEIDLSESVSLDIPTSGNLGCPCERWARRGSPGYLGLGVCRWAPQMDPWASWVVPAPGCLAKQGPPIKNPASLFENGSCHIDPETIRYGKDEVRAWLEETLIVHGDKLGTRHIISARHRRRR